MLENVLRLNIKVSWILNAFSLTSTQGRHIVSNTAVIIRMVKKANKFKNEV